MLSMRSWSLDPVGARAADRIPTFHSEAPLSTQGRGVEGAAHSCMRLKAPGAGPNSQPFKDLHLATGAATRTNTGIFSVFPTEVLN